MKIEHVLVIVVGVLCLGGLVAYKTLMVESPTSSSAVPLPLDKKEGQAPIASGGSPLDGVSADLKKNQDAAGASIPSASGPTEEAPNSENLDQKLSEKSKQWWSGQSLDSVISFKDFAHKFALFLQNAGGEEIPLDKTPFLGAAGALQVEKQGDETLLSEKNYQRYNVFVEVVQKAPAEAIFKFYRAAQPLLQESLKELGSQGSVDKLLVEAIDVAVATPEIKVPLRLKSQSVHYQFEDPELEALPGIQKLLIRMGPTHAHAVKAKLKEFRHLLNSKN
jgi:hypothetical protein